MMGRRRILILTRTTALGGAERLLANALPYLDRERFDYRLVALDEGGPLARACREAGLPFHALPWPSPLDPRNALALRRLLVSERIDLVHAHLPLTGALARVACRGLGVRVVYTEHNVQSRYRTPSRWLNAATYGWQEHVVAVSEGVRASAEERIGRAARERTLVIPNGVDFELLDREAAEQPGPGLPRRPRSAVVVLVPASLAWRKGQDVLLDALERLRDRTFPPLVVWLAGDGPDGPALAARVVAGPLAGSVHLLGRRDDVFALMRLADVVALPSRYEGHPLALLEALALARPVVAARVGGVPEIVADGVSGLLVPPEDSVALAAALDRLRRDPALRRRLGEAGARDARRRFDVRRTVAALEDVYTRCLSTRGTALGVHLPRRGADFRSPED
jgi:glycosyltransferase involved in cell wall biosynthesis